MVWGSGYGESVVQNVAWPSVEGKIQWWVVQWGIRRALVMPPWNSLNFQQLNPAKVYCSVTCHVQSVLVKGLFWISLWDLGSGGFILSCAPNIITAMVKEWENSAHSAAKASTWKGCSLCLPLTAQKKSCCNLPLRMVQVKAILPSAQKEKKLIRLVNSDYDHYTLLKQLIQRFSKSKLLWSTEGLKCRCHGSMNQ